MTEESSVKLVVRWVALGALFLIPLAPLVVVNSLFFPFITGKAFYLRILIEVAVACWVVLALIDREYRPRFSWLGAAAAAFVAWMFVADAFAPNALKAFWSNFERMEGWVWLIHLLGFFFAMSNVLRAERKWREWFLASLGVAAIVSLYALLQLAGVAAIHQGATRIDASFGNSAYLAIYLLFSFFVAGWLAFTERTAWLKWLLFAFAALEGVLIFFTATRGTILGLIGALTLAALLALITGAGQTRRIAIGALASIVLFGGLLYAARDTAFVEGSPALERITSLSLKDGETRFTIWSMAYKGFFERPVVGWGQEGFNYVFNTYYEPSLYRQEPWFDRAHNAFIDWLMAGGLPAFVLYLSLFGLAVWHLWRSSLGRSERIALTAVLAGYACHNLFVFDNLYSYVYFFAVLAFIDAQVSSKREEMEQAPVLEGPTAVSTLPLAIAALGIVVWLVNVPGMRASAGLIDALSAASVTDAISSFEALLAKPGFAAQEIREQLVALQGRVIPSPSATLEEKRRVAILAVEEMYKQVSAYPADARVRLQLSYAYRNAGDFESARKELQEALKLSPNKPSLLLEAGALEWDRGEMRAAEEYFEKAYALAPQFPEIATYAAAGKYVQGDHAGADRVLLEAYGTTTVDADVLALAYFRAKDWPRLSRLWQLRASKPDANIQTLFGLVAAYYAAGEYDLAIAEIRSISVKHPQAKELGENAIAQIEAERKKK